MSLSSQQQASLNNSKKRARQAATDIATVATLYTQISDNDLDNGSTIYSFITKIKEHVRLIENYQVERIRTEQGMPRVPHMNSAFGTPKLELPRKRKCPEPPAKKKISEMFPVNKDLPEEIEDSDEDNLLDETILLESDKHFDKLDKHVRKVLQDPEFQNKHHKKFMKGVHNFLHGKEKDFDEVDELETSSDKENDETLIDE